METQLSFRIAGGAQPLILVPVMVNDDGPHEFILDTGAGISLLTPELAERVGVGITESKEGMGAGGKITIALGTVSSMAIGQAKSENVPVAITDELRRIGAVIGATVDGNIGYSYLKSFRLTLDYRKLTLGLTNSAQDSNRIESDVRGPIRFKLANSAKPLILIPVIVNGEGPYIFALDTGASTTVISSELAQLFGVESSAIPELTGAGGTVNAASGNVKSLAIADAKVENVSVVVADFLPMLSQVVGTRLDGIIGYNFLREFNVTIDYPNETLLLR